jgi:hypothetical protein
MKHAILTCSVLICALFGCTVKFARHTAQPTAPVKDTPVKLRKLQKLFAVGDFDGDNRRDTLFQHTYSYLTHAEIDSAADPFQQPWDTVVYWFYDQKPDVYLSLDANDTLHLGAGQGLLCLINIGDNNADGRDEVALVIDHLDFSRVSDCRIYSLGADGWVLLKQFRIHEEAFDYRGERPVFTEIKGYLEKQEGRWQYIDYLDEDWYESEEDLGKFRPLELGSCDK